MTKKQLETIEADLTELDPALLLQELRAPEAGDVFQVRCATRAALSYISRHQVRFMCFGGRIRR